MQSWKKPTEELVEKALSSIKRDHERIRFFSRLNNPYWAVEIEKRGYFNNPPKAVKLETGGVQFPYWQELMYLSRVAKYIPEDAVRISKNIPITNNPQIGRELVQIALAVDPSISISLKKKLIEYINIQFHLSIIEITKLLTHWLNAGDIGAREALEIVKEVVPFHADPEENQKSERRHYSDDTLSRLATILKPEPKFEEWEYQEILKKGIRPVAEKKPLEVSTILGDAIDQYITLRFHPDELLEEKRKGSDHSEFWCQEVEDADRADQKSEETLVQTFAFACRQVFEKTPEKGSELFHFLATKKWNIFRRIEYFLCAQYPDKTETALKKLIQNFDSYSKNDYGSEFFKLLEVACEKFGSNLFSESEWSLLFDQILSGPDRLFYQEFFGSDFTEEKFTQRQNVFHKKQFWPFQKVLFGKYKERFDEAYDLISGSLEAGDYAPFSSRGEAKWVSSESPISKEVLSGKTDDELIIYLNQWDNPGRKPEEWWVEISHSGLGKEFSDLIQKESDRFSAWEKQWDELKRPIYLRYALQAVCELAKSHLDLKSGLSLCRVVSQKSDSEDLDGSKISESSLDHPNWSGAKIAVTDFLKGILSSEFPACSEYFTEVCDLLKTLSLAPDPRLDQGWELLVNQKEPMTTAINTVRGRVLEALLMLDLWAKSFQGPPPLPSPHDFITSILDLRLSGNPPLTEPEATLLGVHFYDLIRIDFEWTQRNLLRLFPFDTNPDRWRVIFSNYLLFNNAHMGAFEFLKENYIFAVENSEHLKKAAHEPKECLDRLGIHIVCYYLWKKCEIQEQTGLIQKYYQNTDPLYWSAVVNYLGRAIRDQKNLNSKIHPEIKQRIQQFMEWRISETSLKINSSSSKEEKDKYSEELLEFYRWIPCEGLEVDWRLQTLKSILKIVTASGKISFVLKDLGNLLERSHYLVVECFKMITDLISPEKIFYMTKQEAGPILIQGLHSEDPRTKKLAQEALENLLRAGRFEFLDLEGESCESAEQ